MTPAEHAATVRLDALASTIRGVLGDDEAGEAWAAELEEVATEVRAMAERAEKLEIDADAVVGAMKTAEARATELERERDKADADCERVMKKCDALRERAERAETALREIVEDADKTEASLDQHSGQGKMAALSALARRIAAIARAALGETAPRWGPDAGISFPDDGGETAPATDDQINNSFDAYR